VLEVDAAGRLVRVQPGAVTSTVNEALAPHGLMLGPDPSSEAFSTIGGNLGTNASGARGIRYGSMREHVAYLDVILADGSRARVEPVEADGEAYRALAGRGDLLGRVASGTRRILQENAGLIRNHRPYTRKHSAGYNLFDVLEGGRFDLTRLVVGSEGTLAVIVEAGLRAVPKPTERASLLLWFDRLEKAGEAVHHVLDLGPSACEIMERVFLGIVRADGSVPAAYLPPEADTVLLVEQLSDSRAENEAFIRCVRGRVIDELGLAFGGIEAYDPQEQERLWQVRKQAVQILQRLPGPKRVTPFIEDVSVPPDRLVEHIHGLREVFEKHRVEAAVYGHAGDSNLHARPLLDTRRAEDVQKMRAIADDVAELVVRLGGTVSCEHGDGLARSGYLRLQFGPDLYGAMQAVKHLWDPAGILNPGKVITDERHVHTDDLRLGPDFALAETGEAFDRDPWAEELVRCHGCGMCREFCPVFKVTGDEAASPRGKANLLREVLSGGSVRIPLGLDLADLDAEPMRQVANLCYNCKLCLTEWKVRPMGWAGSATAPVSNWMLRARPVRWVMEKVVGVARDAALPRFARDRLEEGVEVPAAGEPVRRVAYFAGCFELFNEPQIGRAALRVLRALGCEVLDRTGGAAGPAGPGVRGLHPRAAVLRHREDLGRRRRRGHAGQGVQSGRARPARRRRVRSRQWVPVVRADAHGGVAPDGRVGRPGRPGGPGYARRPRPCGGDRGRAGRAHPRGGRVAVAGQAPGLSRAVPPAGCGAGRGAPAASGAAPRFGVCPDERGVLRHGGDVRPEGAERRGLGGDRPDGAGAHPRCRGRGRRHELRHVPDATRPRHGPAGGPSDGGAGRRPRAGAGEVTRWAKGLAGRPRRGHNGVRNLDQGLRHEPEDPC